MMIKPFNKLVLSVVLWILFPFFGTVRLVHSTGDITEYKSYLPFVSKSGYWQPVGPGPEDENGISNLRGYASVPSIAIAPDGTPYVAWSEYNGVDSEVYVRRWDGIVWEEVGPGSGSGGGISNTGSAGGPIIAIAPDGTPYVAWNDSANGNPEIYIRRWNGTAWAEVGEGSASGGGITNTPSSYSPQPKIAFTPDGILYVVWQEDLFYGPMKIYALRWQGDVWEEVGIGSASGKGISNTTTSSSNPTLTISSDGLPYVAWETYGEGLDFSEIFVRRFTTGQNFQATP